MDKGLIFLYLYGGFDSQYRRKVVTRVNGYLLCAAASRAPSLGFARGKAMTLCFPEKCCDTDMQAVPKPTQVGGYKHTKARGRNLVKELGNMAP